MILAKKNSRIPFIKDKSLTIKNLGKYSEILIEAPMRINAAPFI